MTDTREDAREVARASGLRYTSDTGAGFTRHKTGRGFTYRDREGKPIRDEAVLERIRGIVIPPAWTDVWICADPSGHIQATGRDVKGRKQYRYHPRFRALRDETKYEKIFDFADVAGGGLDRFPRVGHRQKIVRVGTVSAAPAKVVG